MHTRSPSLRVKRQDVDVFNAVRVVGRREYGEIAFLIPNLPAQPPMPAQPPIDSPEDLANAYSRYLPAHTGFPVGSCIGENGLPSGWTEGASTESIAFLIPNLPPAEAQPPMPAQPPIELAAGSRPVEDAIVAKLTAALSPSHLIVENESRKHSVAPGSETHFRIIIVTAAFTGLSRLQRHRAIHAALAEELEGSVHALAISAAKTPAQWAKTNGGDVAPTPPCEGAGGAAR